MNQVKLEYNGIDCLTADIQSHAGAVDGSTPKVEYVCTGATDGVLRRTAVVYPDGRQVDYAYGDAGSIDDVLNRVQSVHDEDLTVLAEFQYAGVAMPVVTKNPQPALERLWKKLPTEPVGDGGDPYTGYDRFGRVEQMFWRKQWGPDSYETYMKVQWGYNRASLKTWRRDLLAPASAGQDQAFRYDGLQQVTKRERGVLNVNGTAVGGVAAQAESFGYDETGNWVVYRQVNGGAVDVNQTRVNNRSNQATQVDGSSAWLGYDQNGNMVLCPEDANPSGPPWQPYPLKDELDPVALGDVEGAVVERYGYTAFGETSFYNEGYGAEGGSAYQWDWLFHGEYRDEHTGWYNYGYRYYVPAMGRWLGRDPIGEAGGLNLYVFSLNDPVPNFDIFGLAPLADPCSKIDLEKMIEERKRKEEEEEQEEEQRKELDRRIKEERDKERDKAEEEAIKRLPPEKQKEARDKKKVRYALRKKQEERDAKVRREQEKQAGTPKGPSMPAPPPLNIDEIMNPKPITPTPLPIQPPPPPGPVAPLPLAPFPGEK